MRFTNLFRNAYKTEQRHLKKNLKNDFFGAVQRNRSKSFFILGQNSKNVGILSHVPDSTSHSNSLQH